MCIHIYIYIYIHTHIQKHSDPDPNKALLGKKTVAANAEWNPPLHVEMCPSLSRNHPQG